MRQAVAAGWDGELDDHPSAQALIADLLLRAGRDRGGRRRVGAGRARGSHATRGCTPPRATPTRGSGCTRKALPWQTKGLELALAAGDDEGELAWYLTGERGETMDVLGLRARRAATPRRGAHRARRAAGSRVRARVPAQLAPAATDRAAAGVHRRRVVPARPVPARATDMAELRRGLRARTLRRVLRATRADCCAISKPKASNASRSRRSRSTTTSPGAPSTTAIPSSPTPARATPPSSSNATSPKPWPPQRNEPCWCGSERKYKKCCLRAG